ncbi:hypothetical protein HPB50_009186 [Hyalomma asiaticum]|uniref:Uncharacterized protein n=1 Tax=Hyalomma asiaticum TaxID=266040 RepID=A0ACB7SG87_HYAAI|nr:hypothetical protein HPB50_009186 [Hyalomma asiaticum]
MSLADRRARFRCLKPPPQLRNQKFQYQTRHHERNMFIVTIPGLVLEDSVQAYNMVAGGKLESWGVDCAAKDIGVVEKNFKLNSECVGIGGRG